MLRILKKALAKLRYRAGCHRKRSRISLFTYPALRPSLLVGIEKISTFKIKNFLWPFSLPFIAPLTLLRPPTALYTHFHDLTWITFMLAMVLRSFCAPHIPCTKILFYDFFLRYFTTLTASTARNTQDTKKSWICFLFPLTIPTKWAIPEHRSFIKFFDFDSSPITMRPISP